MQYAQPAKRTRRPGARVQFDVPTHVALGCGIGGEYIAAERAGFNTIAVWDKCPANKAVLDQVTDAHVVCDDISNAGHVADIRKRTRGPVHLVTCSWSCKPNTSLNANASSTDHRLRDALLFVQRACELEPLMILCENVPGIFLPKRKEHLSAIRRIFNKHGYHVETATMDSNRLGSPMRRDRAYILASRITTTALQETAAAVRLRPRMPISHWWPNAKANRCSPRAAACCWA